MEIPAVFLDCGEYKQKAQSKKDPTDELQPQLPECLQQISENDS
jgi:hypothetical protein